MDRDRMPHGINGLVTAVAIAGFVLGSAATAGAVVNCATTVVNPSSPLTDDYETNSFSPCIKLTNGADLDLNGHTITATAASTYTPTAIQCTATGSRITDSGDGKVRGSFTIAIEDCEDVIGIWITSYFDGTNTLTPIRAITHNLNLSVAKGGLIQNNVISADGFTATIAEGINSELLNDDSRVTDNYIEAGVPIDVVGTTSGSGPIVENNVGRFYLGVTTVNRIRLRKNLFIDRIALYGDADCFDVSGTGATIGNNFCTCPDDCPPGPPYELPWQ